MQVRFSHIICWGKYLTYEISVIINALTCSKCRKCLKKNKTVYLCISCRLFINENFCFCQIMQHVIRTFAMKLLNHKWAGICLLRTYKQQILTLQWIQIQQHYNEGNIGLIRQLNFEYGKPQFESFPYALIRRFCKNCNFRRLILILQLLLLRYPC